MVIARTPKRQRSAFRTQWQDFRDYCWLSAFRSNPRFLHGLRYVPRATLRLRSFREEDIPHLCVIHDLLEGLRQVPPGYANYFREGLISDENLTLVIEDMGGLPIACGSVYRGDESGAGSLSFGLVHPDHQGRGLGSAMLFARISLLKPDADNLVIVYLAATDFSRPWFDKLGIQWDGLFQDEWGALIYLGQWRLSADDFRYLRERMLPRLPHDVRDLVVPTCHSIVEWKLEPVERISGDPL